MSMGEKMHDEDTIKAFARICHVAFRGPMDDLLRTGKAMDMSAQAIAVGIVMAMMRMQAMAIVGSGMPVEEFDGWLEAMVADVEEGVRRRKAERRPQ